jgi:cyclophilin family peptidyl-prolyl cis-trans isomerase
MSLVSSAVRLSCACPQHDRRGVVSMANRGPNTSGCQFFITYGEHKHLNNQYTVFGRWAYL